MRADKLARTRARARVPNKIVRQIKRDECPGSAFAARSKKRVQTRRALKRPLRRLNGETDSKNVYEIVRLLRPKILENGNLSDMFFFFFEINITIKILYIISNDLIYDFNIFPVFLFSYICYFFIYTLELSIRIYNRNRITFVFSTASWQSIILRKFDTNTTTRDFEGEEEI